MIVPNSDVAVADVYRVYLAFCDLAAAQGKRDLAHQLVLCESLSVGGEAPMVAASIASAATLCIEPSSAAARHGERSGAIDFTVNNLDEALRALKNEVRKGLSIAICLEGDPASILAEMVERGVQPDVLYGGAGEGVTTFLDRGAHAVDADVVPKLSQQRDTTWAVRDLPGKWLPLVDEIVAGCLPSEDYVRRNWLKRAPRYVGRAMRANRNLPMTAREFERIVEVFKEEIQQARWDGIDLEFKAENWNAAFGTQKLSS
jgi:hypothetical protein